MITVRTSLFGYLFFVLFCVAILGCSPSDPQTGSQTNWLRSCETDVDCGSQSCHCGVCTHPCAEDSSCSTLAGSSCVVATDPGVVALCGGSPASDAGLCLARCGNDVCAAGQNCVAGICSPRSSPDAQVSIDIQSRFQKLVGFGATLAYAENDVVQYSNQASLLEAMFSSLGLDVLRLRNRYGYTGDDNLASAATITNAAAASLGRQPTVILDSWSPPASLKANGTTVCTGDADNCTMTRLTTGGFDYEAYATYWRASLDAYIAVGVTPDYVGIQNNPDFVAASTDPGEACRFLPTEGTATVTTNGTTSVLQFPGYAQALNAVSRHLQGLVATPKFIAPDVSAPSFVADYVDQLDISLVAAIGHHLYGSVPTSPDISALQQLNQLGQSLGRPVFQTEMKADGLGTAVLLHHTLVTEGASAYLHNALIGPSPTSTVNSGALITLDGANFTAQPCYHALRHFALHTDPDWIRVAADSNQQNLLASAFISPAGNALTIVLVNSGVDPLTIQIGLSAATIANSQVTRTVFDGTERSADLGKLPFENVLRLPEHSMATVAIAL